MKRAIRIISLILFTFCTLVPSCPPSFASQNELAADYVFTNGKVYTLNSKQPWAEAVAVKSNRIVFVGSDSDAREWVSPKAELIDLKGRMLMPGFVDGHNHLISGAQGKRGIRLSKCGNKDELLQSIRNYVEMSPEREAYIGFGWMYQMFGEKEGTRQELDAICNDKPIILLNEDTHNAWFNTKAMEKAGISRSTPDPIPGSSYYKREPDGTPNGIAVEPEAWTPLAFAAGVMGRKDVLRECIERTFPELPKLGITAYHDMGVWAKGLADGYLGLELLLEREQAGNLPCRIVGVYGIRDAGESAEAHVTTLKEWSTKYRSELVQITALKIWADGTYATHTGVQLEPYSDKPDTKGENGWTADVLAHWIELAYGAGFDVHIHVQGDGSVRRSLDAFEAVSRKLGPDGGHRSALHHINVIHPDDLPRFKTLGIGGNATLEWLVTYWQDALKVFTKEKVDKEYDTWRKLIDMGVNVSFGSDIPGTEPEELSPLLQMQMALSRHVPGFVSSALPPEDRIPSLEQMLYGYTLGGAYQMHLEDRIGSVEIGKLADLIILESNLFDVPKNQLGSVKVLFTMLDGKVLHKDGDL